jgi:ferredoxin, 2Fe-2S
MPILKITTPGGDVRTINAAVGTPVLKAVISAMVPGILGECGGHLSCATCHVYVDRAWIDKLPARTAEEEDMLEATSEEPSECSRLSCQIIVTDDLDGLSVTAPATQR